VDHGGGGSGVHEDLLYRIDKRFNGSIRWEKDRVKEKK
jgi:hypothetical protein